MKTLRPGNVVDTIRVGTLNQVTDAAKFSCPLVVFARQRNAVVIAHELLHTLGATDKYDPLSALPRFPEGYAEPQRTPRHPQALAEIMGGRIPVDDRRATIPDTLEQTRIGPRTAVETGLTPPP